MLRQEQGVPTCGIISASDPELGELYLYCDRDVPLLFTENETNTQRIFGVPNRTLTSRTASTTAWSWARTEAVNPGKTGTKAAAHYRLAIEARRTSGPPAAPHRRRSADVKRVYGPHGPFGGHFEEVLRSRRQEADEFYAAITPPALDADAANVMRQALAGMLWSKQFYHYDVNKWLEDAGPIPSSRPGRRRPATTTGTTCTTAT